MRTETKQTMNMMQREIKQKPFTTATVQKKVGHMIHLIR